MTGLPGFFWNRWRLLVSIFLVPVLWAGCGSPPSDERSALSTEGDPLAEGRITYSTYCQGCHGPEGRADGPVAPLLSVELSDLTLLTDKYGQFPDELIRATIDGRAEVEGHGTREMPVWGNIWNDPADPVAEERIRQQINQLVLYISSIQQPVEDLTGSD